MRSTFLRQGLLTAICSTFLAAPALAAIEYDQLVTPDVIFGSGNANGSFTVERLNNVELGLRGKLRFNSSNLPENTFNSNGAGAYLFAAGNPPTGFSFDPGSPTTPIWSFEWSVNSDLSGSAGRSLNALTYEMGIDGDPGLGVDFGTPFDPINVAAADHALGDNSTPNGGGVSDSGTYGANIASFSVAQNSWNYEFFNETTDGAYFPQLASFDPTVDGVYTIYLAAFDGGNEIARTSIDIVVGNGAVPEPVSMLIWGIVGSSFGFASLSRRRKA